MKQLFYILSICAFFFLTSCKEEENSMTYTYPISAYNLYTPIDGGNNVSISQAPYKFTLLMPSNNIRVEVTSMMIPGGSTVSFTTSEMPIRAYGVQVDNQYREILKFNADIASQTGSSVRNLTGQLTQAVYPPYVVVPGYNRIVPGSTMHYAVMQYDLDNVWHVRTFWRDMTFSGNTAATEPANPVPYINDDMRYRIVMKFDNPDGKYTADVILYNVKLSSEAVPVDAIVLKSMSLTFSSAGYEVNSEAPVSYIIANNELKESADWKFKSFDMSVGGETLSEAHISYQTQDDTKVSFSGYSMLSVGE